MNKATYLTIVMLAILLTVGTIWLSIAPISPASEKITETIDVTQPTR